jgi:hypothetical protein
VLLFCQHFSGRRQIAKGDADVAVADDDTLRNRLDNPALFLGSKVAPAGVEVPSLREDFVARRVLDLEKVELRLQPWNLVVELLLALLQARISDLLVVPYPQNRRRASILLGSDARNPATEGNTLWVRKNPSRSSSLSMGS